MKAAKQKQIVFTFGCPRAGTTFLQRMLMAGTGYDVYKIPEYSVNHPGVSDTGLLSLKWTLYNVDVVFIRITRDPVEIVKSFYATKKVIDTNKSEVIPSAFPDVKRIASHKDHRILTTMKTEKDNTEKQSGAAGQRKKVEILTVQYENIDINAICSRLVKSELNRKLLQSYYDTHWQRVPVRGGRLSYGIGDVELPNEIMEKLKEI